MDQRAKEIANFRYGLISPIVAKLELAPGETQALIEDAAKKTYKIPYSTRVQVSTRTVERYLNLYRQGGYEALVPKYLSGKASATRIPIEYLDKAAALKRENPRRSILQIIETLEMANVVPEGILKESTVYDYFRKLGLTRLQMQKQNKAFQRFAAKNRNQRWQGDTCHLLYLPDPKDSQKSKKVYLIAWIDDYSRILPHAQCYFEEKSYCLEDSLKKAIVKWGVPSQIYVDNGKVYSSTQLNSACGKLGIQLSHSQPYRPQGRGKVERLFQTIQQSFLPEIEVMLKERALSLDELNEYLLVWVNQHYHQKTHSATKQKPIVRFESDTHPIRNVEFNELEDAFLLEEKRTVRKDCLIKFQGLIYPVERELAGCKVLVRYDPFNLSSIQVLYEDTKYTTSPLEGLNDVPENIDFRTLDKEKPMVTTQPTGLNYLEILKQKSSKGLSYKKVGKFNV